MRTGKAGHSFQFVAMVFRTPAEAAAALEAYTVQLRGIGTPGAYKLVRRGRVVYQGATGPANRATNPPPRLPRRDFVTLVKLSEGRLY